MLFHFLEILIIFLAFSVLTLLMSFSSWASIASVFLPEMIERTAKICFARLLFVGELALSEVCLGIETLCKIIGWPSGPAFS